VFLTVCSQTPPPFSFATPTREGHMRTVQRIKSRNLKPNADQDHRSPPTQHDLPLTLPNVPHKKKQRLWNTRSQSCTFTMRMRTRSTGAHQVVGQGGRECDAQFRLDNNSIDYLDAGRAFAADPAAIYIQKPPCFMSHLTCVVYTSRATYCTAKQPIHSQALGSAISNG